MSTLHEPKSEALRILYWRSEILQVMYWLRGEGFGESVDARTLERFLGVNAAVAVTHLDRLVEDGYLERVDEDKSARPDRRRYTLSAQGLAEGGAEFALSFSELTRPTHGQCSPDCWCHASADEAAACAAEHAAAHE